MRATFLVLVFVLAPAALFAAGEEIDWTPRFTTVQTDGAALQRVYFTDGPQRYAMSLDTETLVEAVAGGARLTYKGLASAEFRIRAAAEKLELPPDPVKLDDYRRAALTFAPQGAADFSTTEETVDPLSINSWKSYRLVFSYNFFGRRHARSVTFLTFPNGQQAVLETSALLAEFPDAQSRSERLIRTWHTLGPVAAGLPQN